MDKFKIISIPKDSSFTIFGHEFHGLDEVKTAVEVTARIIDLVFERKPTRRNPRNPIPGIHVAELYEPYPCFDSEDFATEDRDYSNFFFSRKPFSDAAIRKLSQMKSSFNYRMVNPDMAASAVPALYYDGDSQNLYLAIPE